MGSKGWVCQPDLAQAEVDSFVYRHAGALGMRSYLSTCATPSERRGELRSEKVDFSCEPFCSPAIIELLGLLQLTSQIFKALTVFGFCS